MKIAKDLVAALAYELEVEGKIADKAGKEKPLEYIHGNHMLLPRFEEEVEGKEPGDRFEFTLSPAEGYGLHEPERVIDLPKSAFVVDGVLREDLLQTGRIIPMLNSQGHVVQGTIAEIAEDTVKMDFNHPMAGKTLHFTGEVVAVREATKDELQFGLHGEYLPPEEDGEEHKCCHGKGHCHEKDGDHECCHGEGHCKKEKE